MDYIYSFFRTEVEEVGLDRTRWDRTGVLVGLTALLTYLNWRGAFVCLQVRMKWMGVYVCWGRGGVCGALNAGDIHTHSTTGLDVVGNAVSFISVLSLLPFVILCVAGFAQGMDWGRLAELPEGGLSGVQWAPFLTVVFWVRTWTAALDRARNPMD